MPRKPPSNRIEVDLKLLQDKNAEKLMRFGDTFGKSVDKLAMALSDWNGQVAGGANVSRPGESPAASNAKNVNLDTARGAGINKPGPSKVVGEARGPLPAPDGVNYGWDNQGSASVAESLQQDGAAKGEHSTEQDYARAMRRIGGGEISLQQIMGHIAEGGKRNEKGEPIGTWNKPASRISDAMFFGQAGRRLLGREYGKMNALTGMGQDVGYSREGGPLGSFGIGLLSPAFREGAKTNLKAMWSSKFGLNPNYSKEQATQARATIGAFGYGGDTADFMAERLKQLEIHNRMSPEASMRLLDPAARFGNVEMSQLTDTLNAMPAAAKAARMNLKQFNEQVTQLAESLAANGPASATAYAAQLTAFTGVTGLSPEKGAAMLQSRQQTFMSMGMTGMSYAKATIGPNALGGRLKAPMMIGNQVAQSYGFKDMGALSKGYEDLQAGREVDPKVEQALSSLGMMIEASPDLFGGMNLKELMNNSRRGNVLGRVEAASQLTLLGDKATDADFRRLIGLAGMGKKGIHGYEVDKKAFMRNNAEKLSKMSQGDRQRAVAEHEQAYLQSAFGKKSGDRGKAAQKVTIGLSPEAQKWFKVNDQAGGKDKSNRGTVDSFANKAIAIGSQGWDIYNSLNSLPGLP